MPMDKTTEIIILYNTLQANIMSVVNDHLNYEVSDDEMLIEIVKHIETYQQKYNEIFS